ncbi:MAG: response regulator [Clostridiales bacterium]|nr:response regulator [Clostridiales bacterium]
MTVLILDDEILSVEFMMRGVNWEKCGVSEVLTAYDAEEARRVVAEHPVDIILCDIEMPGDSGIDFMRWARDNGYDMDCIFLTCHAKFEYAQEAVRLQSRDYILKPAPFEVIEQKVRDAVAQRRKKLEDEAKKKIGGQWIQHTKEQIADNYGAVKSHETIAAEAEAYIHHHMSESDLSVQKIADHLNLSSDYLGKIFKQEKEITLNKYIVRTRMETAAALLRGGEISIVSVAEQVGYENYSYFSSSFKRTYGCNPAKYMKKQRG